MKINNKKIIVSTLALAMGAALAGSISGSVAWYQYSTRATAVLEGVSAGTTRNLQIRIGSTGEWKQDLSKDDINTYLEVGGSSQPAKLTLAPSTLQTTGRANNAALVTRTESTETVLDAKGHPVFQYGDLPNAAASEGTGEDKVFNYVQIPLQFRIQDNGTEVAKDLYLVDAQFQDKSDSSHADITEALRVRFASNESTAKNFLFAKSIESTKVSGALDLNNNGKLDRDAFNGLDTDATANLINYGNKAASTTGDSVADANILKQASWKVEEGTDKLLADDTDAYDFVGGQVLGTTKASSSEFLEITMTLWLEGWTELSEHPNVTGSTTVKNETLWDASYIGSDFGLNLRFACEAEK